MNNQHTDTVQTGDVFISSWGHDQTNIDFYEVVAVTPKTVRLRAIASRIVDANPERMTTTVAPRLGAYRGPAFRRAIHVHEGKVLVSLDSCSSARQWDGQPARASHYA